MAVLNPCGFPLLPAFLSFYVGADEHSLPRAPSRLAQGAVGGVLVAAGFLALFAAVALPITYGMRLVADAVPWLGLAISALLVAAGLAILVGKRLTLRVGSLRVVRERRARAMLLFGVGYGLASLGCSLPLFLALIGASLGTTRSLVAFAAYGAGSAVILIAVALAAALVKGGFAAALRHLLPHVHRLAGALVVAAGGYLAYYWLRVKFGPAATLADDPVVGFVTRYTARLQTLAADEGRTLMFAIALAVALAGGLALWQWRRARGPHGRREPLQQRGHAQRPSGGGR